MECSGPCPLDTDWGVPLRLKSENSDASPILGLQDAQDKEICVTVQVERAPISFQIPIFLNTHDFDDTEMIQVARNILHRIFMQLAAESRDWKLTTAEMQRLSKLN